MTYAKLVSLCLLTKINDWLEALFWLHNSVSRSSLFLDTMTVYSLTSVRSPNKCAPRKLRHWVIMSRQAILDLTSGQDLSKQPEQIVVATRLATLWFNFHLLIKYISRAKLEIINEVFLSIFICFRFLHSNAIKHISGRAFHGLPYLNSL